MLTRDFNLRCQSTISSIFVSVFSFSVLMLVWLVSFTIDSASFKLSVSFPGFVPHAFPGSVFSDSTRREEAWTPPQVYQEPQNDKNIVNDDSGSSFFLLQDISTFIKIYKKSVWYRVNTKNNFVRLIIMRRN